MTPAERLALVSAALPDSGVGRPALWLDLGAGDGAFTLALAERLGKGSRVLAVDRDPRALARLRARGGVTGVAVEAWEGDFTRELPLPLSGGMLMANALHFVPRKRQATLLARLARHLEPGGRLVVIEYDLDRGNPWVPHPIARSRFPSLASDSGLVGAAVVAEATSRYWGRVYCGLARRPGGRDADV